MSGSGEVGSVQVQMARDFLVRVAAGDVDEAYRRYVHPNFVHHNPGVPGDRESLRRAMRDNAIAMPNKSLDVRLVLEDGNRVCTASFIQVASMRVVVAHIFRFQDARIIELWDIGQAVPADSPNENGAL